MEFYGSENFVIGKEMNFRTALFRITQNLERRNLDTIPDLNAFLGYDLMMWLAKSLSDYGQEGLIGHMDPQSYGLASGFDIKPVYKNTTGAPKEMNVPLYYENQRIRILQYKEQDFILVR